MSLEGRAAEQFMGFDRGLMEADSASHQGRGALVHLTLAPIFVATLFGPSTLGLEPWRLDLGPSNFVPLVLPEVPGDHFGTQDAPKRASWELLGSLLGHFGTQDATKRASLKPLGNHFGTLWAPGCSQKSLWRASGVHWATPGFPRGHLVSI